MNFKRIVILLSASLVIAGAHKAIAQSTLTPATMDHMVRAEWQKEGLTPAPPVDDARFLRRIYLDITGVIPPPQAVSDFLADKTPDKRVHAVEALLDSPMYAEQWTNYWESVLLGKGARVRDVDPMAFRRWLHDQFDKNSPWNKFVYDLVTATGQNSTGTSYAEMAGVMKPATEQAPAENTAKINGAVNFLLKFKNTPEDLSGTVSKIFLGVQIQCAQCHNHKTEKWTQSDFRSFTANFMNTRSRTLETEKIKGRVYRVDVEDVNRPYVMRPNLAPKAVAKQATLAVYREAKPAALDGTDFSNSPNRRQALASWMTADENPWFAEAIVNRMWGHFMGRGFIEAIDDIRPSNPVVLPELLKALSADFKANGYDLKHLIRTICSTQAYQLSASAAAKTDVDNKYWARYHLKPMGPAQLVDSLALATNIRPVLEAAGSNLAAIKIQMERQFSFLFDVDEEFDQKDFEGTIPAALMLLNGPFVNHSVTQIPGTALAETMAMPGSDDAKIEALYLRTVSRMPTSTELKRWRDYINMPREVVSQASLARPAAVRSMKPQNIAVKPMQRGNVSFDPLNRIANRRTLPAATPREQAYEDIFWALLNSSEFLFNH